MIKSDYMRRLIFLLMISVNLTSCGDSDSMYITSISNNTDYEIIVSFSVDSTIVCQPNQETIIEEYWGSSVKEMSCMTPYIFKNSNAEIIIDDGNKILTKDITDDNNWSCEGDEDRSLIMVGSYYSKITTTFVISEVDIKDADQ
jgi:hypothetical protein